MSSYPNLPGTQLFRGIPALISVGPAMRSHVLVASGKGPAGVAYQVTQRSLAASDYGSINSSINQVRSSCSKQQPRARLARQG
jgi:hypothetical protein